MTIEEVPLLSPCPAAAKCKMQMQLQKANIIGSALNPSFQRTCFSLVTISGSAKKWKSWPGLPLYFSEIGHISLSCVSGIGYIRPSCFSGIGYIRPFCFSGIGYTRPSCFLVVRGVRVFYFSVVWGARPITEKLKDQIRMTAEKHNGQMFRPVSYTHLTLPTNREV